MYFGIIIPLRGFFKCKTRKKLRKNLRKKTRKNLRKNLRENLRKNLRKNLREKTAIFKKLRFAKKKSLDFQKL